MLATHHAEDLIVAIFPDHEIEIHAFRSQGAGGQNVNKVSTAIHLRFDIHASSLPAFHKNALLNLRDQRISADGVITIKAQQHRTLERNREDALDRLRALIQIITIPKKSERRRSPRRVPTNGGSTARNGKGA